MRHTSDSSDNKKSTRLANQRIISNGQINLIALAHVIWDNRRTIYYSFGGMVVIGFLIAFTSPVQYRASATILPQTEEKTNFGNLGGLASMAGINLGSMMGNATGIRPSLYPRIINSYPFLNDLVHHPFNFKDESHPISFYEKRVKDSIPGFGAYLKKYTIRLPWTLKNAIFEADGDTFEKEEIESSADVTRITVKEAGALATMRAATEVEVDNETGLVTITTEMGEPLLTAEVASKTVQLLQQYIIEFKTRQAKENLNFIEDRYQEKKKEFEEVRTAFFEYRDRNHNVIQERTDLRFQELNDAYNLSSQMYTNLAEQREQAELTVKRNTPAFSIIEPVKVPLQKSGPSRAVILILSAFMGGFIGICVIFGRILLKKLQSLW
jgi:uncharacterized protein involved in exopolysaccharide biosynthesis